jgi:hypothetical protein
MTNERPAHSAWERAWIPIGAVLFVLALIVSALVVPQLRPLHFFQALIYVAVVILARRKSAWGFGAGVTIAIIWNSLNLFVTHLMQAGAAELWLLLRTGHVRRLDTLMVLVGGVGHFILIVACLTAFLRLKPGMKQWGKFIAGGVLTLAYLVLIVVTMAPH